MQNGSVEITLTRGYVTVVDAADAPRVCQHKWHYAKVGPRAVYAACWIDDHYVYLHGFLLGRKHVDHVNGDGLDNRRSNLRVASKAQNGWNSTRRVSKEGYRGVYRAPTKSLRWCARIRVGEPKVMYLGSFDSPAEAAAAYDAAARKYHGEFARANA